MPARFLPGRRSALFVVLFVVALGAAGCINQAAIHDFAKQANTSVNDMKIEGAQPALDAQRVVSAQYLANLKAISDDPPERKSQSGDDEVRNALSKAHVSGTMKSSETMAIEELGQLCLTTEPGVWPYYDIDKLITKGNPPFQKVLCGFQRGLIESIKTMSEQATSDLKKAQENLAAVPALPEKLVETETSQGAMDALGDAIIALREGIAGDLVAKHTYIKDTYLHKLLQLKRELDDLCNQKTLAETLKALSENNNLRDSLQIKIKGKVTQEEKAKTESELEKIETTINELNRMLDHARLRAFVEAEIEAATIYDQALALIYSELTGHFISNLTPEDLPPECDKGQNDPGLCRSLNKLMILVSVKTSAINNEIAALEKQAGQETNEKLRPKQNYLEHYNAFYLQKLKPLINLVVYDKDHKSMENLLDDQLATCKSVKDAIDKKGKDKKINPAIKIKACEVYTKGLAMIFYRLSTFYIPYLQLRLGMLTDITPEEISEISKNHQKAIEDAEKCVSNKPKAEDECKKKKDKAEKFATQLKAKQQARQIKLSDEGRKITLLRSRTASLYIQAYLGIYKAVLGGDLKTLEEVSEKVRDDNKVGLDISASLSPQSIDIAYLRNSLIRDAEQLRAAKLAVIQGLWAAKQISIEISYISELSDIARTHKTIYDNRRNLDDKDLIFKLNMATRYLQASAQKRTEEKTTPGQIFFYNLDTVNSTSQAKSTTAIHKASRTARIDNEAIIKAATSANSAPSVSIEVPLLSPKTVNPNYLMPSNMPAKGPSNPGVKIPTGLEEKSPK